MFYRLTRAFWSEILQYMFSILLEWLLIRNSVALYSFFEICLVVAFEWNMPVEA
jgi:hypothetical protein